MDYGLLCVGACMRRNICRFSQDQNRRSSVDQTNFYLLTVVFRVLHSYNLEDSHTRAPAETYVQMVKEVVQIYARDRSETTKTPSNIHTYTPRLPFQVWVSSRNIMSSAS